MYTAGSDTLQIFLDEAGVRYKKLTPSPIVPDMVKLVLVPLLFILLRRVIGWKLWRKSEWLLDKGRVDKIDFA